MKRILFIALSVFSFIQGYSQDNKSDIEVKNESGTKTQTKVDIGYEGIALAYDVKVLPSTTMDLNVGIGGYYDISESNFDYYLNPTKPAVFVSINPKYFYNQRQRAENGKNTNLNSGNYIGIKAKYSSKSTSSKVFSDEVLLYNIHWGVQRALGTNTLWSAYAGVGYGDRVNSNVGTLYPVLGIKFSYLPFLAQ